MQHAAIERRKLQAFGAREFDIGRVPYLAAEPRGLIAKRFDIDLHAVRFERNIAQHGERGVVLRALQRLGRKRLAQDRRYFLVKYVRDDDNAIPFPQARQQRRRHDFALHRFGQEPRHCDTGIDDDAHH